MRETERERERERETERESERERERQRKSERETERVSVCVGVHARVCLSACARSLRARACLMYFFRRGIPVVTVSKCSMGCVDRIMTINYNGNSRQSRA